MRLTIKILSTIICTYVLFAKAYALLYYIFNHKYDFPVLSADLIIIYACVASLLLLWRKKVPIKCKTIVFVLILGSLFVQFYSGLFNLFIKNPSVNQEIILWTYDIPNLLSIFILTALMCAVLREWKENGSLSSNRDNL